MLGVLLEQVAYTVAAECIVLPKTAAHICRLRPLTADHPQSIIEPLHKAPLFPVELKNDQDD